jgi:hypothetical protein
VIGALGRLRDVHRLEFAAAEQGCVAVYVENGRFQGAWQTVLPGSIGTLGSRWNRHCL